jgi:uncharacterized membrane protein
MAIYVLAFLIGVVAGLRSMTAPAVVSWAARLGWLHVENTGLAFLGFTITPYILSVLTGALCGAALGVISQALIGGLLAGVLGGVAGTLGGYEPA